MPSTTAEHQAGALSARALSTPEPCVRLFAWRVQQEGAVGRMDVRTEIAEFFNRDGLIDYPDSDMRFQPDEVIFTPGTRAGLALVLDGLV